MTGWGLACAVFCTVPVLYSHSVPTHQTNYHSGSSLHKTADPSFSALTETQLQTPLQIGTVCEDAGAACSDPNPRFVFHFLSDAGHDKCPHGLPLGGLGISSGSTIEYLQAHRRCSAHSLCRIFTRGASDEPSARCCTRSNLIGPRMGRGRIRTSIC